MKDAFFWHSARASQSIKLRSFMSMRGKAGYGFFIGLIEIFGHDIDQQRDGFHFASWKILTEEFTMQQESITHFMVAAKECGLIDFMESENGVHIRFDRNPQIFMTCAEMEGISGDHLDSN